MCNSTIPAPPGSKTLFSCESTPTMSQPVEGERGQLKVGAHTHPDQIKEKEEEDNANPPLASLNSRHETNGGAALAEPGAELIVWWDEPEDQNQENPMNWSSSRKWVNIIVISVISFLV